MGKKQRVLILCTGNSCRSQMAEGLINHDLGEEWEAVSAGTSPGRVTPYAIRAMEELGIDISQNESEHIDKYLDDPLDLVVTVCGHAAENCPVFPRPVEKVHLPFHDPVNAIGTDAEIMAEFRTVRDDIRKRLLEMLQKRA